ncbi:Clathrin interactor EPSIN 2-like protein [Drosera capensis]
MFLFIKTKGEKVSKIKIRVQGLVGDMSMKKAFDQTIRDLKREVNKKVLKVPSIEQKVLDATSNEPWGPHGSLLSDIAHASRNYHEYQMIMAIVWRRISDTGKNWRHVYKALTVLEYLVAHGSERVIDEIREHAYQISTLADFQYIDSSGRDQGNNVRRKSQGLVLLVNDKERIQEARQKAASNRDKYRNPSAMGGMHRPNSYGDLYDQGRYGSRDEDGNDYGRERSGYRDDGWYGRDGDRFGRDSEEQYGRESYRDDDYAGRSRSLDGSQHGSRRSSDKERENAFDNDDRQTSQESGNKAENHLQEASKLERKFSEQNLGPPPSYEEAVGGFRSPGVSERDEETLTAPAPNPFSPPASVERSHITADPAVANSHPNEEAKSFDEFDPRGSVSAAPVASSTAEMDLLGSLSDSWSANPMALVPVSSGVAASELDSFGNSVSASTYVATHVTENAVTQSFEDPFGDSPFKAVPSRDGVPAQSPASVVPSQQTVNTDEQTGQAIQNSEFADTFQGLTFSSTVDQGPIPQELPSYQGEDILAGILPPTQTSFVAPTSHPSQQAQFLQTTQPSPQTGFLANNQPSSLNAIGFSSAPQAGHALAVLPSTTPQSFAVPAPLHGGANSYPQTAPVGGVASDVSVQMSSGIANHQNNNILSMISQSAQAMPLSSQRIPSSSSGSFASVPEPAPKFETKSTVWADTLSRGLVNLNISGPKTNPLSDIGVDFEALNRKEKRMEKPSNVPVTSTVNMGKAMGSGTGIGRAGAGALRPSPSPMMGPGMGMGGMGPTMGYGYGGMNQPPMGYGVGMGMMAQRPPMQPMNMMPPGSNQNAFNPAMGHASYAPQQPYGGGYR